MGNKREVIIDNDFLQCLTNADKNTDFFIKVMRELDVRPAVHPYVREREMFLRSYAEELIKKGELTALTYEDFITAENKAYYQQMFDSIYYEMNGIRPEYNGGDAFSLKRAGHNLGEIHSLLLGLIGGYDVLLSNDQGAKDFAQRKLSAKSGVRVKDVIDVFEEIAANPACCITKKEFDMHIYLKGGMGERKKELKKRWV